MLSSRLFIAIYETPGGVMIADFQPIARGLRFGYNNHGASVASWSAPSGLFQAFNLYAKCLGRHVEISASGHGIWKGRVEDIKITSGGVEFTCYGYQRALSDIPYTGFLSSTRTDLWETAFATHFAAMAPDRFHLTTKDGLGIYLQRGDTYINTTNLGGLMFRIPDKATSGIYTASFDWSTNLPTGWSVQMQFFDAAYGIISSQLIATGNGAVQSGSISASTTNAAIAVFFAYNNSGANYVATGETGTQYARLTNIRLKGTNSAALGANEIAGLMAINTAAANPSHFSSSLALIQGTGIDLRDEIWEDTYPAEILNYLAALGDSSSPPRVWEWGVTNDQVLYFRPRGSGRSWCIDVAEIDVERTLDGLMNSVYATYAEPGGRALRTATSTDAISVARNGVTRRTAFRTSTTVNAQATTHRDAALADGSDPRPRSGIEVSAIFTTTGQRVHPWMARSGDTITIRNLPPTVSADVDRLRTFVLSELEFDADTGIAKLVPEDPTPSLDVITARYAANMPLVISSFGVDRRTRR